MPPSKTCGRVPKRSPTDSSCAVGPHPAAALPPGDGWRGCWWGEFIGDLASKSQVWGLGQSLGPLLPCRDSCLSTGAGLGCLGRLCPAPAASLPPISPSASDPFLCCVYLISPWAPLSREPLGSLAKVVSLWTPELPCCHLPFFAIQDLSSGNLFTFHGDIYSSSRESSWIAEGDTGSQLWAPLCSMDGRKWWMV